MFNITQCRCYFCGNTQQHMVKMSYDVVKRWVNEAQEAASSDNIMVQVDGTLHRKTSCCVVCVCVDIDMGRRS